MLSKAPETFKHPLILSFGSFADLFFDILAVEHRKTMTVFVKSSRPVMTIKKNGGDVVVNTGMPEGFCLMLVCFNQQAPNSNEIISGDVWDRMKPSPKIYWRGCGNRIRIFSIGHSQTLSCHLGAIFPLKSELEKDNMENPNPTSKHDFSLDLLVRCGWKKYKNSSPKWWFNMV